MRLFRAVIHTSAPSCRSAKLQVRATAQAPRARAVTCCQMAQENSGRRQALGLAAAALAAAVLVPSAKADLTADLLAKSAANAELHNKQRLATSNANFARSRTVTDGTCKFPQVGKTRKQCDYAPTPKRV